MKLVKSALKLLARPIGYLAVFLLRFAGRLNLRVSEKYLVSSHLLRSGSPLHPNKAIFIRTLSEFDQLPLQVVETGTSAWGADSTRLWDEYVRIAGGLVLTVDIRPDPSLLLQNKVSKSTKFFISDSVEFLEGLAKRNFVADLIYLDSFDVDWDDPLPAEEHGRKEFEIAKSLIRIGGIILIDDTPTHQFAKQLGIVTASDEHGTKSIVRGKGAKALSAITDDPRFEILNHEYAVAIKRIS